jgi:hypothetical protein
MRRLLLSVAALLFALACTGELADSALAVVPSVTVSFGSSSIPLNGSTSLDIIIGNPNAGGISSVNFTDSLPSGLEVAAPSNLANDCNGAATAQPGSSSISLSSGSIAGLTICDVSLDVVGTSTGQKDNTVTVGSSAGSSNPSTGSVVVQSGIPSVTVGSPLTASTPGTLVCGSPLGCTLANGTLGEAGATVASPVSGTVVRWRIAGNVSGNVQLRVVRPAGGGQYTGGAIDSGSLINNTSGTLIFVTNLPIQAGDLIGVITGDGDHLAVAAVTGSTILSWFDPLGAQPLSPGSTSNQEVLFNADVEPGPPGITGLSPTSGSIAGGTSVVISGHEFMGATSVELDGKAATGFTVDSNNEIKATSPSEQAPGPVDVSVTTSSGTSPAVAADQFTYTACVVPKVKGKSLKAARKKLSSAGCRLGKRKGHGTKVKKQGAAPGSVLPPGTAVSVKLG